MRIDGVSTGKQLDGNIYRRLGLVVSCLYHQPKCAISKHPRLQQTSIMITCFTLYSGMMK